MCGIAGAFFYNEKTEQQKVDTVVKKMSDRLVNRGPDSYGYWCDQKTKIGFGHRRLSILDLNARSDQPMISDDGRYTIVFNGEIYNFRELRSSLEAAGETFKTTGDTEVILKSFIRLKEKMLSTLRGMFAIAIWDSVEKKLFLARDPYGIKPMYYSNNRDHFLFASQVKAILDTGIVSHDPSPRGQAGFWLMGSVPEPHTWFNDIQSLPAGTWCEIDVQGKMTSKKYWDIADSWKNASECDLTDSQIQNRVREAVFESVKKHLISDVPVGVFLSGGIDSASVAGLIQDSGVQMMKGLTITFKEFQNQHEDESVIAAEVAKKYGFEHHIRVITREEFQADLPQILKAMDQPSLDGINTWYATKAVKEQKLKVVLSGVGGDELFWGYPSFRQIPDLNQKINILKNIPGASTLAQLALGFQARRTNNERWNYLTKAGQSLYGAYWLRRGLYSPGQLSELMGKDLAAQALNDFSIEQFIQSQVGELADDEQSAVAQLESMVYMRNQLLRDSDWASMDHSVELRTPLVDAWLLKEIAPLFKSFHRFPGKTLLANSPKVPLDKSIIERRKTGFGIPLGQWLNGVVDKNISQSGDESRQWAKVLTQTIYR